MKAVQKFSHEYLEKCKTMSPDEIVSFVDDFRCLHGNTLIHTPPQQNPPSKKTPSKLISMKVPEDLLNVFKAKAKLTDTPYQTQIKKLMNEWTKL